MTSFRTKSFAECTFSRHLLMRKWQTTSYQNGWRFPADWFLPEVRTVVTSLATRASVPPPTARSLGAARARNGVGIGETMTDFRALFLAADRKRDIEALQSLAEGWAEAADSAPPISCTDVETGLATQAHFQRQIHELSVFGTACSHPYALAILSLPQPLESRVHRWTLLARLGETVQRQLHGTGATAMYKNSAVHVRFPLSANNLGQLMECRTAMESLGEGALRPARMQFFPLANAPSEPAPQDYIPEAM